jgi:pimeloyl-ACP methyl ester carboxylesterase
MTRPLLTVIAYLVVACGNDRGAVQPDAAAGQPDAGPGSARIAFAPCTTYSAPLECGTLVVPADYTDPGGATIALPVVRGRARDPAQRVGVLAFNFGGPGEPTLDGIATHWPHQPIASSTDLTERFDFIAIDWRGVATSEPALSCLDAGTTTRLAAEEFAPGSAADWATLFQLVTDVDAGCTTNPTNAPLLGHTDTASAARDLDALRAGLGETTLNLWVVSYGTRVGQMYAELFPDRVRAVVLDSPMAPVPDFEGFLQDQSASFEAELSRFFAWCAASTDDVCPFRTADGNAASVAAAFEALLAQADSAPVVADGVTLDRPTIDAAAVGEMYFPSNDWVPLGKQLAALGSGDGSLLASVAVGVYDDGGDDNAFSGYQNIIAEDFAVPAAIATGSAYEAWVETQAAIAPHIGVQNANEQAFALGLPFTAGQPAIGATTAPPLLVTATRNDPATPYANAQQLIAALANGSYLITYEGDGHANGQFQDCLGDPTAAFLLDPTTPPAVIDCAAVEPSLATAPPRSFPEVGRAPLRRAR